MFSTEPPQHLAAHLNLEANSANPGREQVVVETDRKQRVPGLWKGEFDIPDSFFDPLPPEELEGWE